ncbi:MAG: organomercurial lyase, partial [Acidimicrobiales bacterium]
EVESVDALTGESIHLSVSTGGVEHRSHPDAVVSLLSLEDKFDPDVLTSFCHYIHFFTTPQNGEKWAAQHDNVFVVRLDDAFELGRRFVAPILDGGGLKAE